MNLLVLGPKASKRQKVLEPRTQEVGACALHNGTPHCRRGFTSRKQGSQEARTVPQRHRRSKASAQTHQEGLRGIPALLQGGRTSRPERSHTCDWGGGYVWIWATHFSLSSARKSPGAISRPQAAPPVPILSTHPQATLPRLHVKASSAATRKLISSRWPASLNYGSFRVVAVREGGCRGNRGHGGTGSGE